MTSARPLPPQSAGSGAPLTASAGGPIVQAPSAHAVFAEHAAFVLRSVRRLGVRESEVEDVAQEVFVVVHRKLATWNGTSTMRTWLFGIALRVASAHRRKAHVRRELPDGGRAERSMDMGLTTPAEQPEIVRNKELRRQLDGALDTLDENKRAVFVLYELEGFSLPEIAEALLIPLGTATSRLRRARGHFEAWVAGRSADAGDDSCRT
jgi:RNA polymerase sigma-70 factor, ECF subfamily